MKGIDMNTINPPVVTGLKPTKKEKVIGILSIIGIILMFILLFWKASIENVPNSTWPFSH